MNGLHMLLSATLVLLVLFSAEVTAVLLFDAAALCWRCLHLLKRGP